MNILQLFIDVPNAENFKKIKNNSWMLTRVYQKDPELAKRFFKFEEWYKIITAKNVVSDKEKTELKELLRSSVSSFDNALNYFNTLEPNEQIAWEKNLISYAKTVKDLQQVMSLVSNDYHEELMEKMKQIEITGDLKSYQNSHYVSRTSMPDFFEKKSFIFVLQLIFKLIYWKVSIALWAFLVNN